MQLSINIILKPVNVWIKFIKEHEKKILAVAICYDFKNKEHECKIEGFKKHLQKCSCFSYVKFIIKII